MSLQCPCDSEAPRAGKARHYSARPPNARWTLGPGGRHGLAQVTQYFVKR